MNCGRSSSSFCSIRHREKKGHTSRHRAIQQSFPQQQLAKVLGLDELASTVKRLQDKIGRVKILVFHRL